VCVYRLYDCYFMAKRDVCPGGCLYNMGKMNDVCSLFGTNNNTIQHNLISDDSYEYCNGIEGKTIPTYIMIRV